MSRRNQILEIFAKDPRPKSPKDLAEILGVETYQFSGALTAMVRDGELTKPEYGVYAPATNGTRKTTPPKPKKSQLEDMREFSASPGELFEAIGYTGTGKVVLRQLESQTIGIFEPLDL